MARVVPYCKYQLVSNLRGRHTYRGEVDEGEQ